jgi:hypothetical protein
LKVRKESGFGKTLRQGSFFFMLYDDVEAWSGRRKKKREREREIERKKGKCMKGEQKRLDKRAERLSEYVGE